MGESNDSLTLDLQYQYNYDYIPPLALSSGIHLQDLPQLEWTLLVGKQVIKLAINLIMQGVQSLTEALDGLFLDNNTENNVKVFETEQQHAKHLTDFLQQRMRQGSKEQQEAVGEVDTLLGYLHNPDKNNAMLSDPKQTLEWVRRLIKLLKILNTFAQPVLCVVDCMVDLVSNLCCCLPCDRRTLDDYKDQFVTLPLPDIAQNLFNDQVFTNLQVAGFNPLMLRQVQTLPATFFITDAKFRQAPGFEHDNLSQAMAEGRLYLSDYNGWDQLRPGHNPTKKFVYRPVFLSGVPVGAPSLAPIAIQVGQSAQDDDLFGPVDGPGWNKAKTCVQSADANYHELVSHLGRTHLLVEPFVVATHRKLPHHHPLRHLLMPHFEGTIFINGLAVDFLVNKGGPIDYALQGTITSDLELTAYGLQAVSFNDGWLPTWMAQRGLNNPEQLPDYPYRDDGMLLWDAIHQWCHDYVNVIYPDQQAMLDDSHLAQWAADVSSQDGGRINGFGDNGDGEIKTLDYLVNALTMIIFTASAGHAAVNFPQLGIMSYTPAVPFAGYEPPPTQADASDTAWIDMLPYLDMANLQLNLLTLLGGVYYTRLGQYGDDYFEGEATNTALSTFQKQLVKIEKTIHSRNQSRAISYPYLLPTQIPQSINI